jgi:hypothetical protein
MYWRKEENKAASDNFVVSFVNTILQPVWCRVTRTGRAVLRSAGIIIKCWRGGTRYFLVIWLGANSNDSNNTGATDAYWLSLTSWRRCRNLCRLFFITLSLATSWQKIWRVRNNDRKWMLWVRPLQNGAKLCTGGIIADRCLQYFLWRITTKCILGYNCVFKWTD